MFVCKVSLLFSALYDANSLPVILFSALNAKSPYAFVLYMQNGLCVPGGAGAAHPHEHEHHARHGLRG